MAKKWSIVSSDFKPMEGGVAEFAYQIACELHKQDLLAEVITPVSQNAQNSLPARALKPWKNPKKNFAHSFFVSKLNSIKYKLFIFNILVFLAANKKERRLLFCLVDNLFAYRLINFCIQLRIEFSVLLHGKEILDFAKADPGFLQVIASNCAGLVFNSAATKKLFWQRVDPGLNFRKEIVQAVWYPVLRFDYLDQLVPEKHGKLATIPQNAIIISSVCRLVERKGLHFAIQAFLASKLQQEFGDVYFLIAGDGAERDKLKKLAQINQDKILFLGSISDQQKKELLLRSHIFMMPNYSVLGTDFEGFGISFIEAAYFGNIVIGGRSGGAVEAIQQCPIGHLVETDASNPVPKITETLLKTLRSITPGKQEYLKTWQQQLRKRFCLEENTTRFVQDLNQQ